MQASLSAAAPVASVLSHPRVFRIGDIGHMGRMGGDAGSGDKIRSGFDALDRELAGGGWARPGVTEILCDHTGIGELSLLMKGLGAKENAIRPGDAVHLLWVLPQSQPWIPYAPALAQCGINLDHLAIVRTKSTDDALWAAEQGLKSGACRAVLLRLHESWVNPLSLRRLNQAAMAGNCLLWLLRPLAAATSPSPAGTRIALHPDGSGAIRAELFKRRGLPPGKSVRVATRPMMCLGREPVFMRDSGLPRPTTETSTSRWLDNVLSADQAPNVTVRSRSFDAHRR